MKFKMVKTCPHCKSTQILSTVYVENSHYYQRIFCKKCNYENKRIIGDGVRK